MFKKVRRYLKSPYYALGNDLMKNHPHWMSDKYYLRVMWKSVMGYPLDLKNPVTFNEKLQWMKLYDRNPQYTLLVDKYRVKDWVSEKIGAQYVIKTLDAWDSIDEIDISNLPNQFVLKCNHDSGGVVICENKENFDFEQAKAKLRKSFEHNFYWDYREWPYKNVGRKIFAEEFISDKHFVDTRNECFKEQQYVVDGVEDWNGLTDYKFFCFEGEPKIMYKSKDKSSHPSTDFYDMEGNVLPIRMQDPPSDFPPKLPQHFKEMQMLSEKLSKGLRAVRVDFYEARNQVFFGEMTFFHAAGFSEVKPKEWNVKMGGWIKL